MLFLALYFHTYVIFQSTSFYILVGPLYVDKEEQSWDELIRKSPAVGNGGAWSPDDCQPEAKVCIFSETFLWGIYVCIKDIPIELFLVCQRQSETNVYTYLLVFKLRQLCFLENFVVR